MPVEFGVWRIDSGINPVAFGTMDLESRLEEIFEKDISNFTSAGSDQRKLLIPQWNVD
jgi:hypothetical protein